MSPVELTPLKRAMIREIHIENFRGIENLHLSFVGPDGQPCRAIALGGPNGSGKTTVLEAILLAAGRESLLHGPFGRGAVRAGCRDYRIAAKFQSGEGFHEVECHSTITTRPVGVSCDYFPSWRAPKLIGPVSVSGGKKGKRRAAQEVNRLSQIKQYLVDAKAYSSMSADQPLRSAYEEIISRINNLWEKFYPGSGQSFSAEPAGESPAEGFDVFLNMGQHRVPLDCLSSGQLELFMFAGAWLPGAVWPSILCIDEPELHLDASWHRLIVRTLMQMGQDCQFIVGTHSSEVFDSFYSFQRHFLSANLEATEVPAERGARP